jgi:division protein CdvB (Snf7/Vps24/ESCRT-III family)
MADESWLETFENWSEVLTEYVFGPEPQEVIRRANASIRTALLKLERERKKSRQNETQLLAEARKAAPGARSFADVRPALLAVANARRSGSRIDHLVLKMRSLQQQLVETEVNATTGQVMHRVTHALAQASAITGGLHGVQRMVLAYDRQKALLEMTQESLGTLEDEEEDEATADEMLAQIAAEASLQLSFDMPALPGANAAAAAATDKELEELMVRFQRLTDSGTRDHRGPGGSGDAGGSAPFVASA